MPHSSRWFLYDELLEIVPGTALVKRFTRGEHWLMIESDQGGIGMAHTFPALHASPEELERRYDIVGQPLRKVAALVKSWDFNEAGIGLAALNAAITAATSESLRQAAENAQGDAFDFFLSGTKGKKVSVIGHFPYLDTLRDQCELSILERVPRPGDLPDTAAEYILPEQGFVYITGTTFVNKTITRLLELTKQAVVCLVGPSTPMHPLLFRHGVASLSGLLVLDYQGMADVLQGGGAEGIFDSHGMKVNMIDGARR